MTRTILSLVALVIPLTLGCSAESPVAPSNGGDPLVSDGYQGTGAGDPNPVDAEFGGMSSDRGERGGGGRRGSGEEEAVPVVVTDGVANISGDDSRVDFVGSKPDGTRHTGGFASFTGQISIEPDSNALSAINVEIQTGSVFSDDDKLTAHLKSPDFFNVREHPLATFASTEVKATNSEAGEYSVTGSLTLLGMTQDIEFPATAKVVEGVLQLSGKFEIDRTQFGMTYGEGKVDNAVAISVAVGPSEESRQRGGGRFGGRGGGGRGGFDPAAMFAQWDTDGDGKLAGDEIPERMRENIDSTDTDKDGAVTLEEFQERMRQMMSQRGGSGRGRPGGGRGAGGRPGGPGGGDGRPAGEGGGESTRPQRPATE